VKSAQELLRHYSDAAEKLAPLSKELANVVLSYEADVFMVIWGTIQLAQELCEDARQALEFHTASHGCARFSHST
jgi:hypothetical protein